MYTFFWRDNKNSMRLVETYLHYFKESKSKLTRVIRDVILFSDHLEQNCYIKASNLDLATLAGIAYLNKIFTRNLFHQLDVDVQNYWGFVRSLNQSDYAKMDIEELIENLKKFNYLTEKIWYYFVISQAEFFYDIEKKFKDILRGKGDCYIAEKYFGILTTPVLFDKAMLARFEWVKILHKGNIGNSLLIKFARQHPALFFPAIWSDEQAIRILREKYKRDKKEAIIIKQEKKKLIKEKKELKNKQSVIINKYDSRVKYLSEFFQKWGVKRFDVKFCWSGSEFILSRFFQEIARRTKIRLRDLMFIYREKEVEELLKYRKVLSRQEVKKRYLHYLFHFKKEKITFLSGKKAYLEMRKLAPAEKKEIKELKGQIANPGEIKGVVHVVSIGNLKEMDKFQKGEILLTPMTQPNMVPIAQKAGAIVTDEGGIISHAAIISREFNIPCIVGTKIATKVLKDGDKVLVDANKGIVKKL